MRAKELRVEHVGRHAPAGEWHIATSGHPEHEMVAVLHGQQRTVTPAGDVAAGAGDVLLFQRGLPHAESGTGKPGFESLFFSFAAEGLRSGLPLRVHDSGGRIRQLLAWLLADRDSSRREVRESADALAGAILAEFARLAAEPETSLVEKVRTYVREHIDAPLTLDGLAKHAGLSKYHFLRKYRKLAGRSPMADVRAIRISHARDLILTTRLPLKVITRMAGLNDEVNLSRLFRKHLNVTPGGLRGGRGRGPRAAEP